MYDPAKLESTGQDPECIPGVTKCLLVKLTGAMGESTAVSGNVATMESHLGCGVVRDSQVLLLNTKKHALANQVVHDDLQQDYRAAGEHTYVADGN